MDSRHWRTFFKIIFIQNIFDPDFSTFAGDEVGQRFDGSWQGWFLPSPLPRNLNPCSFVIGGKILCQVMLIRACCVLSRKIYWRCFEYMDALFGRGHTHFPIFDHTLFECVDWPGLHFKTIYGCGGVLVFEVANFDVDMSVHNQKKRQMSCVFCCRLLWISVVGLAVQ